MSSTRTFRVFVSSTFEDLHDERNILQTDVYPVLAHLCDAHGARFQAVDLRWGVRDEAALDHRTMDICLGEIERCQQTGIKPNFLVLLGERYGWRPVPASIDAAEFEQLLSQIGASDERTLITAWYRRDDNAIPPQYLLKTRTGAFVDDSQWRPVESRLLDIIAAAARAAHIGQPQVTKYLASATHQEILKGLGESEEDRRHVVVFCRTDSGRAADPRLTALKEDLRSQLGDRVIDYPARDLSRLSTSVRDVLSAMIERELTQLSRPSSTGHEITSHDRFADALCRDFVGRQDAVDAVRNYLDGSERRPLAIDGQPGSGKSALMAWVSDMARATYPGAIVIRRFIGATATSSAGRMLLNGICAEIAERLNVTIKPGIAYHEIVSSFAEALSHGREPTPLIVFIDALDQLAPDDPARTMDWLPSPLSLHCKVIVSFNDRMQSIKATTRVSIGGLLPDEATRLFSGWMTAGGRTLQPEQQAKVRQAIERCTLPLYVRLAFEEARRWRSFDATDDCMLGRDLDEAIDGVLDRVSNDANHGRTLVEHSLDYLSAARHGLTEDEMLALLSRDEQVRSEFERRARHTVPSRQLPPILWSRLYADLSRYLFERTTPDGTLIAFYHRQFTERFDAVRTTTERRNAAHEALAKYFAIESDPGGDQRWTGTRARGRRELLFHFARSQQSSAVLHLLSSLSFLNARVQDHDVYGLLADYDLIHLNESASEWRAFINRHGQALIGYPRMLVSLVNHEGAPRLREQAESRRWPFSWLRTSTTQRPVTMSPSTAGGGLRCEIQTFADSDRGRLRAYAPRHEVAFCFERLGRIAVLDARTWRESPSRLSIRTERPLRLSCSHDAANVLVFFESGIAEMYACELDDDGRPVTATVVAECRYRVPEIDEPIVDWWDGACWFQSANGSLARMDVRTGAVTETDLPSGLAGELAALHHLAASRRVVAVRNGTEVSLTTGDGDVFRRSGTDLFSSCTCDGRVAVAFTDGALVVYDVTATPRVTAETRSGVVRGAIGFDGQRLFWYDEDEGLRAWTPGDAVPQRLTDDGKIFGSGLHTSPRAWETTGDGATFLLSTHAFVRLTVTSGEFARSSRVEQIFGGRIWRTLRSHEKTIWLWEADPCREITLTRQGHGRLYGAPDARGRFYAADVTGRGQVWNLALLAAQPIDNLPTALNLACADPDSGCWFTDRAGDIFYVDSSGYCEKLAEPGLVEVHGSVIHVCGNYLVWRGYSPQWEDTTGVEQGRTFVVFRRAMSPRPRLEKLGERRFAVRDGVCLAMDATPSSARLVSLWHLETGANVLRVASPPEFLEGKWTDCPLTELAEIGMPQVAISPDERMVGIVSQNEFACVETRTGEVAARLTSSSGFTHVAAGPAGAEFWLVEARDRIYHCRLEEP
jgi:hypothetical protein